MDDEEEMVAQTPALRMSWQLFTNAALSFVSDVLVDASALTQTVASILDADDEYHRERKDMENAVREAIEEIAAGAPLEGN